MTAISFSARVPAPSPTAGRFPIPKVRLHLYHSGAMHNVSIIINEEAFPVETVRIEPLERGRVALFVKSPIGLHRGQSCRIQTSTGAEMECVVSEVYPEPGGPITELRCIAESAS